METVEGFSKSGFGRLGGFEFVPDGSKVYGLIFWKKSKESVGGLGFACCLVRFGGFVVDVGVAGVDLHDVVDEGHFQDFEQVEIGLVGMFAQHYDHEGEVPGVLGIVFAAGLVADVGLPENVLQLVRLDDEIHLLEKAVWEKGHRFFDGSR